MSPCDAGTHLALYTAQEVDLIQSLADLHVRSYRYTYCGVLPYIQCGHHTAAYGAWQYGSVI